MRLIKTFGLAALAAVAAVALIGASSASAEVPGRLCQNNENPCANPVEHFHFELTVGTGWKVHDEEPEIDILCLKVLTLFFLLSTPTHDYDVEFNLENCGVNAAHNNCTFTVLETILADLLKIGANLGDLELLNGKTLMRCTVFGFIKLDCEYTIKGLQFIVDGSGTGKGNGMINAANTLLPKTFAGELCPETSQITEGLLEPLEPLFITS